MVNVKRVAGVVVHKAIDRVEKEILLVENTDEFNGIHPLDFISSVVDSNAYYLDVINKLLAVTAITNVDSIRLYNTTIIDNVRTFNYLITLSSKCSPCIPNGRYTWMEPFKILTDVYEYFTRNVREVAVLMSQE
jgi:hypothetical protein